MAMPPLRMQPAFTALTCTFSHASLAHLAFNMIAFTSFGGNMSQVLQSPKRTPSRPRACRDPLCIQILLSIMIADDGRLLIWRRWRPQGHQVAGFWL